MQVKVHYKEYNNLSGLYKHVYMLIPLDNTEQLLHCMLSLVLHSEIIWKYVWVSKYWSLHVKLPRLVFVNRIEFDMKCLGYCSSSLHNLLLGGIQTLYYAVCGSVSRL